MHEADDFRDRAFAKTLRGAHADDTRQIDAARHHFVAHAGLARHALACQGDGVQRGAALQDDAVERHLLAWPHDNHTAYFHLLRAYVLHISPFNVCHIGAYVHQVCYAVAALALGVVLEQLAHLEKQHHKDCFGKFRLGSRQEADAQGTDGGHRHQEVLVEGIAVGQSLGSLLQRVVSY